MLARAYRRQRGCDFISAMPTNLYGPGDNFDLNSSHVIPALISKAHEAKAEGNGEFVIWGSGSPRREFLHVDDAADALVYLMTHYSDEEHINVGCGSTSRSRCSRHSWLTLSVRRRDFHRSLKPDGTPRKLLDVSKLVNFGWRPKIDAQRRARKTYRWYLDNVAPL